MFGLDLAKTMYIMSMGAMFIAIAPLIGYSIATYIKRREPANDWVAAITDGLFVITYTVLLISSIIATNVGWITITAFVLVVPVSAYGFWKSCKSIAAQRREQAAAHDFLYAQAKWLEDNGYMVDPFETCSIAIDRMYPGGYANFLTVYRLRQVAETKQ